MEHSRASTNTSGYKGVTWHRQAKAWYARVRLSGHRRISVGLFGSAESAARVYDEWVKQAHGEFAVLNLPEGT